MKGTAAGPDRNPITTVKLPHVGGHEGVGRVVGIRFASRICRRCEYCLAGK